MLRTNAFHDSLTEYNKIEKPAGPVENTQHSLPPRGPGTTGKQAPSGSRTAPPLATTAPAHQLGLGLFGGAPKKPGHHLPGGNMRTDLQFYGTIQDTPISIANSR